MKQTHLALATALAALLSLSAVPALAASSASSASSDGSSASVGSSSTSVEKSSESSTGDKKTAAGDYRIVDVAQAPQRPGTLRLTLQALATDGPAGQVVLLLPQQAAERGALAAGQVVSARERAYGMEFAKADQAFFLVLDDAWFHELNTRALTL